MRIAVLGAGAFGTALSVHLRRIEHEVAIWTRNEAKVAQMRAGVNPDALQGVEFEPGLRAFTAPEAALEGAELAVLATPSLAIPSALRAIAASRPGLPLVCAAKGIDPETLELHSEIASTLCPDSPYCTVTGPSFAREILSGQPTALLAASTRPGFAREIQDAFSGPRLRVYESDDVRGAELSGALKNVIAIAAGMVAGMKCGENTRAALITRGLAEVSRVCVAGGGKAETAAGLAGLGDLVLSCSSNKSRNYQFGRLVAEGQDPAEILASLGTVEGLRTTSAACRLGEKHGVETPIATEVRGVLVDGVPPREAVAALMLRRLKREVH